MQPTDSQKIPGATPSPASPLAICLLLAAITFALYWPATGFDFVDWDDTHYVVENTHLHSGLTPAGLGWAFTTEKMGYWQPMVWLSFMLDVSLFGRQPGGFHLTNILLHAANVVLVFLLFRRMTGAHWRSALVAALFALHPLRVESVAWVTERKDVLSALFGLLSLLAYERYTHSSGRPRFKAYLSALLFFTLGLMSKAMLVTLPIAMLLLDYWPLRRLEFSAFRSQLPVMRRLLVEKLPFFALSAIFSVLTFVLQKRFGAVISTDRLPFAGRVDNAVMAYIQYLGKIVWPVKLAFFYPLHARWPLAYVAAAALALLLLCVAALWLARKRPYVFTGWFWFLVTIFPVIGLSQSGGQALADRFTYIPLIGIFAVIAWSGGAVFERWKLPPHLAIFLAAILLAACAWRARDQLKTWRNSHALFAHAVAVTRNNYIAEYNLALGLANEGRYREALPHYREAIRVAPNDQKNHLNYAIALERLGQTDEAAVQYGEALRIDPKSFEVHYNYACLLLDLGRRAEAIDHFKQVLVLKPGLPQAEAQLQRLGVSSDR